MAEAMRTLKRHIENWRMVPPICGRMRRDDLRGIDAAMLQ
jgi:hypothetical protein